MIWIISLFVLGFLFSVGCCCGCTRCLECADEEIEALGVDVTISGLADSLFFGCDCDPFNGTWHLPFAGFLDEGRGCEFLAEFDFNYCGAPVTLSIRVSMQCGEAIDVAVATNGAFVADARLENLEPKLACDFSGVNMTPISWQILCDTTDATITLSAA